MIIRVFHARVRPGKQHQFKKALEILSLPTFQSRQGMLSFYPGQPLGPDSSEFILVTIWRDQPALEARSSQEWARLLIPKETLPLLEDWELRDYQTFGIFEQPSKPLFQNI